MGHPPAWYRLISAARYLGVPPWELSRRPTAWVRMAEAANKAEVTAHNQRQAHRQKVQRFQRRGR